MPAAGSPTRSPTRTSPGAAFAAHCVELLAPFGPAQARRMFGGHGVYVGGAMVGLIAGEQLYLKTDAQTLARWQAAGGRPFVYATRRGPGQAVKTATMSYWTPPEEAMESAAAMQPWGRLALEAAWRARAARESRATAGARSARGEGAD